MKMNMNKIGFIKVSNQVLENFWFNNKWLIPLRAEVLTTHNNMINYLCYCDRFRLLGEYDVIPMYELVLKKDEDGVVNLLSVEEVPQ